MSRRIFLGLVLWVALVGGLTWQDFSSRGLSNCANPGQCAEIPEPEEPEVQDRRIADYTLWLMIFTGILGASTLLLWWETRQGGRTTERLANAASKTAAVSEDAARRQLRAYMSAQSAPQFWEPEPVVEAGQQTWFRYNWRLRAAWWNSGDTPTKNLRLYIDSALVSDPLPADFDFRKQDRPEGSGLIAPKSSMMSGAVPFGTAPALSPNDIADIVAGRKRFYMWGWARYHDVFPDTEEHITRFAWQIFITGDPFAFQPAPAPSTLNFSWMHLDRDNCADDECNV